MAVLRVTSTMSLRGAQRRGNPFSLLLYKQACGLQGMRIATPACALVRDDMVIFTSRMIRYIFRPPRWEYL